MLENINIFNILEQDKINVYNKISYKIINNILVYMFELTRCSYFKQ
jgi:hypothetical protein